METNLHKMRGAEFSVWMENFCSVFESRLIELNLSNRDSEDLRAVKNEMQSALYERQAAVEMSQSKTVNLRDKHRAALKMVSHYKKLIKANETLPGSLIELLGFDAEDENRANFPPLSPADLVAEGFSSGLNLLRWKPNGNLRNTQYIVEARKDGETAFTFVGVTTKTKFEHKNQRSGVRVFYRVKAQRHDEESPHSNEAVVY